MDWTWCRHTRGRRFLRRGPRNGNQNESPSKIGPLDNPFEKPRRPQWQKPWKVLKARVYHLWRVDGEAGSFGLFAADGARAHNPRESGRPPILAFACVFPSDSTWHPRYLTTVVPRNVSPRNVNLYAPRAVSALMRRGPGPAAPTNTSSLVTSRRLPDSSTCDTISANLESWLFRQQIKRLTKSPSPVVVFARGSTATTPGTTICFSVQGTPGRAIFQVPRNFLNGLLSCQETSG